MTTTAHFVDPGRVAMSMNVRAVGRGYVRDVNGGGHVFLAGPDDSTAPHVTYPTGYAPECGWCWLNAPHTVAAHATRIAEVTR